jgi:hypothetical protein
MGWERQVSTVPVRQTPLPHTTHPSKPSTDLRVDHILQVGKVHRGRRRHTSVRRGLPSIRAAVRAARPARRPLVLAVVRLVLVLWLGLLGCLLLLERRWVKHVDAAAAAPVRLLLLVLLRVLLVLRRRGVPTPVWLLVGVHPPVPCCCYEARRGRRRRHHHHHRSIFVKTHDL